MKHGLKNILVALCVMLIAAGVQAQSVQPETVDILWTVQGSKWVGHVLEWDQTEGVITFETLNGATLLVNEADIKKIRQQLTGQEKKERTYAFPDDGLYQAIELGISAAPEAGLSGTYVIGLRLSRMLGVGVGFGYENFQLGEGKRVIPIFAEARGFLRNDFISPYYAVRVGYGVALENRDYDIVDTRGGLLLNPEIGVRFGANPVLNFYAGFGLHIQDATFGYNWGTAERITDRYSYRRAELKLGVVF